MTYSAIRPKHQIKRIHQPPPPQNGLEMTPNLEGNVESRGQSAPRPLYCGRRGLELCSDSPTRRVFEGELQVAEIRNFLNMGAEGTKGKTDLRVAIFHVVDDEQAIYQQNYIWNYQHQN